jgi:hypothetical protein
MVSQAPAERQYCAIAEDHAVVAVKPLLQLLNAVHIDQRRTIYAHKFSGIQRLLKRLTLIVSLGTADCPGTNSPADVTGRLNDPTCDVGIPRGIGGFLRE